MLDMKDFNRGVKAYNGAISKMTIVSGTGARKMTGALGSVAKFAGKTLVTGVALGAAAIAGLGLGMAKLAIDAAPLAGVKAAFEGITESSGVAADQMLAALKESSAGMLTNADAMTTYNLAAQLVGTTFANDLPNAMGYLTKISAATGESMDYMMTSLVRGVGRLSPLILDNLGIQVDLTEAYEDYGKELGHTGKDLAQYVKGMSKADQQAALMAQVMAKLEKNTAAMPEVTGTAAAAMGSLQTQLQDTKDAIGLALLPAFTTIMGKVNEFAADNLPRLVEAFEQNVVPAIETGVEWLQVNLPLAIDAAKEAFGWVIERIDEFKRGFAWATSEGMSPFAAGLSGIAELLDDFLGEETMGRVWDFVDWAQKTASFIEENLTPILAGLGTVAAIAFGAWAAAAIAAAIPTIIALAPVIAIVAAIGAAVALLAKAWESDWGGIRTVLTQFWNETAKPTFELLKVWFTTTLPQALAKVRDWFVTAWENITSSVTEAWEAVVGVLEDVEQWFTVTMPDAVSSAWDTVKSTVEDAVAAVGSTISSGLSWIKDTWESAWNAVRDFLGAVWDGIRTAFVAALILFLDIFGIKLEDVIEAWRTTWDAVSAKLSAIWETLKTTVSEAAQAVYDYIKERTDEIAEAWGIVWDYVSEKATEIWEAVKTTVGDAAQAVYNFVKARIDEISEAWTFVWDAVSAKASEIWETIKTVVGDAIDAVWQVLTGMYDKIKDAVTDPLTDAWEAIKDTVGDWLDIGRALIQGLIDGVRDKAQDLIDAVTGPIQNASDRAKKLLRISSASKVFYDIGQDTIGGFIEGFRSHMDELFGDAQYITDELAEIFDIARVFGGVGRAAGRELERQILDPATERLKEVEARIAELEETGLHKLSWGYSWEMEDLQRERLALTEQIADAEGRIAEFQERQQQLAWLQQQIKLLDLIADYDLDAAQVMRGMALGIDANAADVLEAMTRALSLVIEKAQTELGIASPSKVFELEIGRPMIEGVVRGIEGYADRIASAMGGALAVPALFQRPAMAMPAGGTTNTLNMNMGGVNIYDQMSAATFEARVRQIVTSTIGG